MDDEHRASLSEGMDKNRRGRIENGGAGEALKSKAASISKMAIKLINNEMASYKEKIEMKIINIGISISVDKHRGRISIMKIMDGIIISASRYGIQ